MNSIETTWLRDHIRMQESFGDSDDDVCAHESVMNLQKQRRVMSNLIAEYLYRLAKNIPDPDLFL